MEHACFSKHVQTERQQKNIQRGKFDTWIQWERGIKFVLFKRKLCLVHTPGNSKSTLNC